MTALFVGAVLKASLIVLLALAGAALFRSRSAAVRHWILSTALIAAASLPALGLIVPVWDVTVVPPAVAENLAAMPGAALAVMTPRSPAGPIAQPFNAGSVVLTLQVIWVGGALLALAVLAIGLWRLAWIASRASSIEHGIWRVVVDDMAERLGVHRAIQLHQSDHPTLLVTWGFTRPKVLLPASARDWPEDRIRVVLGHELAHIARGDWVLQMTAEILRSIYWFNPLLWIAAKRLRLESEHACDDVVLQLGVDPSNYASELIDLARTLASPRQPWSPALAVARRSGFEGRIRAMLNTRLNRAPVSRAARAAAVLAFIAVTLPVAALQTVVAQTFATFSGAVFDEMNGVLPNVTMTLTNTQNQSKYEVHSDPSGRFEFVGLPQGGYTLQVRLPGFSVLNGSLTLTGQNAERDIRLSVGSLEETITVTAGPTQPERVQPANQRKTARPIPPCGNGPTTPSGAAIGGNIRPPWKLVDVRPIYPAHLAAQGVVGMVVLDTIIGVDGLVRETRTVGDAHPELAAAAADAVRQWEFDQTLLNCTPVDVRMKVTVQFQTEQPAGVILLRISLPNGGQPVLRLTPDTRATIRAGEIDFGFRVREASPNAVSISIEDTDGKVVNQMVLAAGAPAVPSGTNPAFEIALAGISKP